MIPFYAPHEYLRHKAQEHFYATYPESFEEPDKTHGFRSRSSQDGSRHHECQENFSLAILQTCRQIYHEVKDVLYFSNTFFFRNPPALPLFASSLLKSSANPRFATRSLHLSIQLRHGSDHDEWNIAIRHISIYIRTVQSLCINLNLDIADPDYLVIRYSAIMSSTFHLVGEPYQLRFLPLKTLVVIVADEDWAVTRRREERFSTLEDESPETGTCEKNMKLRSGAQVAQVVNGGIAQNTKVSQAIAEHNASSPLLMLPQEIKNRIYYFVCGGQMVHILQNDNDYNHAHGDWSVNLTHAICIEPTSEEQIQKDFDSADSDVAWNIASVEDRHRDCYKPPPEQEKGPKRNQLSLTLLRSCRQIYMEASTIHYRNNTFAINCHDILERFVRGRLQNKQNLAIRSLHLDISVTHGSSVDAWSEKINKAVLRHLKSVRHLYLSLTQVYCTCYVDVCAYEGSEMTERQGKMFKKLSKLPLKEATLVIDDGMFLKPLNPHYANFYDQMEQQYRWTLRQKQEFSKEVRDALLARGDVKKKN